MYTTPVSHPIGQLTKQIRLAQTEYPLISPLLACDATSRSSAEDIALESEIKKFIQERQSHMSLTEMSVYVFSYKSGMWAGVGERQEYDPASMLKVPIMLAYYRAAEKNPQLLDKKISFAAGDLNAGEYFRSPDTVRPGKLYSIEELIDSMILHSDNTAATLLFNNLADDAVSNIYRDLHLPAPDPATKKEFLSAELYGYFFRVLYNATYLSPYYSQKALDLMTQAEFLGIRDGIASGVPIAEKFGERTVTDEQKKIVGRELHDCGLVYKPDAPYILCIMSRSDSADYPTLQKNISELSTLVYRYIQ